MTHPPRESADALPPALMLVVAIACGVVAAMTVQVLLAWRGIELGAVARDLTSAKPQLHSAIAWWASAAAACLAGAAVVRANHAGWSRLRPLRWIAAAAVVFLLGHVGHSAGLTGGGAIGLQLAANFASICTAALMALVGAHFAARR